MHEGCDVAQQFVVLPVVVLPVVVLPVVVLPVVVLPVVVLPVVVLPVVVLPVASGGVVEAQPLGSNTPAPSATALAAT